MNDNSSSLQPSVLVIFGISGNLSVHKLLPALYQLLKSNRLPDRFTVVGVFHDKAKSIDAVMQQLEITMLRKKLDCEPEILERLKLLIRPAYMDSTSHADYEHLRDTLVNLDHEFQTAHQRLFYLAIPPKIFKEVISCLGDTGLNSEYESPARRIFIEKPFGMDLGSAKELVEHISHYFSEQQIYRIDHYLAKETAQNILTFRFNNPIIDDIWGRQFIDHIQISATQKIDIENRVAFYEGMGALRDIVQSHLLQLLALITMEAPTHMDSQSIHQAKQELFDAIQVIKPNHVNEVVVRGQYDGYRDEVNNQQSTTETFVALKLEVSNSRWGGVPILLRTGKSLQKTSTEINVVFKDRSRNKLPANVLTIRIQPNEGIGIRLTAKKPGFENDMQPVNMDFSYNKEFDAHAQPDAYERVLVDAIAGDQSLFATSAEVIRSWEILQPVLDAWQSQEELPHLYAKGSWGPHSSEELAKGYGNDWINAD